MRPGGTAERLTAERNLFYNCCHICHRAGRRLPGGDPAMSAAAVRKTLEA
jgi:hypothetical protein